MQPKNYAISGGEEGKKRLNKLAAALQPYTSSLLIHAGVQTGCSFLDLGCGGGNVSMLAAQLAGEEGRVTGVDYDPVIVQLAQEDLITENIHNIAYQHNSAYDINFTNEFDFVYARFLLSHLNDPMKALLKMKQAAKQGGKIIAEDIQFSRHFSYPDNAAFKRYQQLYAEVVKRKGGDAELGADLPLLFMDAGIKIISMDVIQPAFSSGDGKWLAYITMDKIKDSILEEGVAGLEEINSVLQEMAAFTNDKNSIISMPGIYRITGIKD